MVRRTIDAGAHDVHIAVTSASPAERWYTSQPRFRRGRHERHTCPEHDRPQYHLGRAQGRGLRQHRPHLLGAGSDPVRPRVGQPEPADAARPKKPRRSRPSRSRRRCGSARSSRPCSATSFPALARFTARRTCDFLGARPCRREVTVTVDCREKREEPVAVFDTRIVDAVGQVVCQGTAEIEAPDRHQSDRGARPADADRGHGRPFRRACRAWPRKLPPLKTAVVCPEDHNSLGGALLSAERGLIEPILIGDPERINAAAKALGADLSRFSIESIADPHLAAARAVAMVLEGEVGRGDEGRPAFGHPARRSGQEGRRPAHLAGASATCSRSTCRRSTRSSYISDAAINIAPDLMTKVDIVQNAIDLARACGLEQPRVGILSAVETINPAIPSTLDAAILSKMAERGQIRGGDRRRAAGDGQRHRPRGGAHQGHHLAGRGPRQRADRAQSRIRQHARQGARPSSRGRKRRGWCSGPRFRSC